MDDESTRPLLELAVVGVVSGAGGALLSTLLRIRHERGELVRERMLTAADDFAASCVQTFIPLRALRDVAPADQDAAIKKMAPHFSVLIDDAVARFARIELLFGPGSKAAEEAGRVIRSLSEARVELEKDPPDLAAAARHSTEAPTSLHSTRS